jgi:hypothetical protein
MSVFYDLASLVLVPSGYKAEKVYAQKPLTADGQLTFSRASTATRVNASGLIEEVASNVPRLDYTNSTCPKLLLEPSRTNVARHNSDFTNAVWVGGGATVVANQAVSPDGATTADLIYPPTSGNFAGRYQNLAAGTTGVLSCYVKQAGKRFAQLGTDNNATYTCAFDLQLGTVARTATNYTGTITSVGNGWYRITAAYVSSAGQVYPFIGVSDDAAGAATTEGTNGLYLWGFQYEVSASYATSVIPTTTAAVTRLADTASKTGISSLIGQTAGTVFVEFEFSGSKDSFWPVMTVMGAGSAELIEIYGSPGSDVVGASMFDGGATQFSRTIALTVGRHKLAIAYELNNTVAYLDGTVIGGVDTSCTIPTMTEIALGKFSYSSAYTFGDRINQALLFKTRLTNAQLAEITQL